MMFHNSTTIYRFTRNTAFVSGERRMVYGIGDKVQGAVGKILSFGKSKGKIFGRAAFDNPFFRLVFAPFFWAKKGVDLAYEGTVRAAHKVEWAGRTAFEAGKGLLWKSTTRPALTLGLSALRNVKMCLWDLPISVVKGMIRFPIALAKSPLELVRGVRDSIVSVPKNVSELYTNLKQLDVRNSVRSLLKLPKEKKLHN